MATCTEQEEGDGIQEVRGIDGCSSSGWYSSRHMVVVIVVTMEEGDGIQEVG